MQLYISGTWKYDSNDNIKIHRNNDNNNRNNIRDVQKVLHHYFVSMLW